MDIEFLLKFPYCNLQLYASARHTGPWPIFAVLNNNNNNKNIAGRHGNVSTITNGEEFLLLSVI